VLYIPNYNHLIKRGFDKQKVKSHKKVILLLNKMPIPCYSFNRCYYDRAYLYYITCQLNQVCHILNPGYVVFYQHAIIRQITLIFRCATFYSERNVLF